MGDEKEKFANELCAAGVAMRKAQKDYFRNRTQENLYRAKDAEAYFDRALRAYANFGHPLHPTLI